MKKSTKIISLIMAMVMVLSFLPVIASAGVVPSSVTTVEQFIKNDNLATIVDWLLKNLAGSKENVTGTVLRLVFTFMKDETLEAKLVGKDPVKLTDDQAATILLDWLDANLPEWTSGLTSNKNYGTISNVTKLLGIDISNLKNVNGILNTLYDCGTSTAVHAFGDLKNLKAESLKISYKSGLLTKNRAIQRSDGDKKVVYALLNWLDEISPLVEDFVKGGISSSGLSLGSILNSALGDSLEDINAIVKNLPTFLKSYIYLTIDGKAEAGDIKKDPAGDWGKSAYASYTADQMLAAALIRLIEEKEPSEVIAKADCDAALKLSVYELLAKYGPELYNRFAIEPLNTKAKTAIAEVVAEYPALALDKILNVNYNFTADTFKDEFAALGETGVLGQLNNIVVKIAETMLTADTFKALGLEKGTNAAKLNSNLEKILRVALPIFNTETVEAKLGFNFDQFTAESVKTMDLETMAVAALKIFFPTWFGDACKSEDLEKADTLEKVGTLAVYYTYTKYVPENVQDAAGLKSITLDLTAIKDQDAAYETILNWSGKTAAAAIASSEDTRYTMPASGTYTDYFNSIVDWALNFVKGLPAAAVKKNLYTSDKGYFYKLNVVLNALIDLSFINGMNDGFVVDLETLVFEGLLGNILDFDVAGLLGLFEKNSSANNSLNKTPIKAVLGIADKALTALFTMESDPETAAAKKVTATPGDVDGVGGVTVSDARLCLRAAVKLENYAEGSREAIACDVDGTPGISVSDARIILRVAVKLQTI